MHKDDLIQAHRRIAPYIHHTPILTSQLINNIAGADLHFKCENFQKAGSFKIRGATNAILQLTETQKSKGVVTHSSGNFAQAFSLAAKIIGIKAFIAMPSTAPQVKKDAVSGYGGTIVECAPTPIAREDAARDIEQQEGATFVHPSNDMNVVLGQGTAAKELLTEQPDLDYLFTPVGGGGLIAGTALAGFYFGDNCKVKDKDKDKGLLFVSTTMPK